MLPCSGVQFVRKGSWQPDPFSPVSFFHTVLLHFPPSGRPCGELGPGSCGFVERNAARGDWLVCSRYLRAASRRSKGLILILSEATCSRRDVNCSRMLGGLGSVRFATIDKQDKIVNTLFEATLWCLKGNGQKGSVCAVWANVFF